MFYRIETLITIILLVLFVVSRILLNVIRKKHQNDPDYQEEKQRREEEYRLRLERENEALRNFAMMNEEYSDDNYRDDVSNNVSHNMTDEPM